MIRGDRAGRRRIVANGPGQGRVCRFGQTGETVLSRVVRTLLRGGVTDVAVVAGAHIDAVRTAMPSHEPRARVIEHPGWQQGQLSSLLAGLDAIDDPLLEAVLVTLVDVPLVRRRPWRP